jgi:hypothetical protein
MVIHYFLTLFSHRWAFKIVFIIILSSTFSWWKLEEFYSFLSFLSFPFFFLVVLGIESMILHSLGQVFHIFHSKYFVNEKFNCTFKNMNDIWISTWYTADVYPTCQSSEQLSFTCLAWFLGGACWRAGLNCASVPLQRVSEPLHMMSSAGQTQL